MYRVFINPDMFPLACDVPVNEQQNQKWHKYHRNDFHFVHLQGIGGNFHFLVVNCFDAMTSNQQTVRIYTVGRAGHQRDNILAGENRQLIRFSREDDENPLDLVGVHLIQHIDCKRVALNDLI